MAKNKLKKKRKTKTIDWDSQPLGQVTDTQIAKKLGVSRGAVREARRKRDIPLPAGSARCADKGIDWENQPLGKVDDRVLAKQLGVTPASVYSARRTRGIPALVSPEGRRGGPKYIDWDNEPLGEDPDEFLALMLDVSISAVARARSIRGIDPFRERGVIWTNE